MKTMYEALNELEDLNSTLDKEAQLIHILKTYRNAERFFKFAFNDVKYGVQEQTFKNAFLEYQNDYEHISDWLASVYVMPSTCEATVSTLEIIGRIIHQLSGNSQIDYIRMAFDALAPIKMKWFCRAILKDLRCGVQVKTLNKALKYCGMSQIAKFSMQLCDKLDIFDDQQVKKKLTFPCSMECKYDGIRIQATIWTEDDETFVELMSRRGTDRTNDFPDIVNELKEAFAYENIILDGEVIAGSFQKLTRKDDNTARIYVVFDLLVDEELPYLNRFDNLRNLCLGKGITAYHLDKINNINVNHIYTAEHYSCNSIEEAQEYYEELNIRKEEGLIIKLDYRPYERGSRKHMFKVKKVYTADLKCIGYKLGEGKRANKVATLVLVDSSGQINVDVGSGIDDAMCDYLTANIKSSFTPNFVGQIVEILYNEITETGSLRFPRFIKFREDKDEADDLSNNEVRQQ